MKFYIVDEPYFALIKAVNKVEVVELYEKYVADDDGSLAVNIEEISRDKALVLLSRSQDEDGELMNIEDVIYAINESKSSVILIDGLLV